MPRKSVVRLTDRPDMTLDVSVDVKQQQQLQYMSKSLARKLLEENLKCHFITVINITESFITMFRFVTSYLYLS